MRAGKLHWLLVQTLSGPHSCRIIVRYNKDLAELVLITMCKAEPQSWVLLKLSELIFREVTGKLPSLHYANMHLVCKPWRDQISVDHLAHTIHLKAAQDLESRAGQLRRMYPNIILQVDVDRYSACGERERNWCRLIASPVCNVVTLPYNWTSTTPNPSASPDHKQAHFEQEEAQTKRLLGCLDLVVPYKGLDQCPQVQLALAVNFDRSILDPEKANVVADLGHYTCSLDIIGDLPCFLRDIPLYNLTKIQFRLPRPTSAHEAATAVSQIQSALISLSTLCCLHVEAYGDKHAVQPAAVVVMLPQLPRLTSLGVDTGINPCCLEASFLTNITHLWLGNSVTFDVPPTALLTLHLTCLSERSRPMMEQLEQQAKGLSRITMDFFTGNSMFEVSGLLQLPVNLSGLQVKQCLDGPDLEPLADRVWCQQGLARLSQLQSLLLNEPMTEPIVKLLMGCEFPRLHRLGFWVAEKALLTGLANHADAQYDSVPSLRQVLVSLPVQFADLSKTFPFVEVMEVLGVQLQAPHRNRITHCVLCLDSWWTSDDFASLKRVWNRCCNCSLRLCNTPPDCRVVAL